MQRREVQARLSQAYLELGNAEADAMATNLDLELGNEEADAMEIERYGPIVEALPATARLMAPGLGDPRVLCNPFPVGHGGEAGPYMIPQGAPGLGAPLGHAGGDAGSSMLSPGAPSLGHGGEAGPSMLPLGAPGLGGPPGRPTRFLEHMIYNRVRDLMHESLSAGGFAPLQMEESIIAIQLSSYQKALVPKIMLALIYEGMDWFLLAMALVNMKDEDYYQGLSETMEHLNTTTMKNAKIATDMGKFYGYLYGHILNVADVRSFHLSMQTVALQAFIVPFLWGNFEGLHMNGENQ